MWYIYGLRQNIEGSKYRYIGYTTVSTSSRLQLHKSAARKNTKSYAIYNWIRSIDYDVLIEIIEECSEDDINNLYDREIYWIAHYREIQGSLSDPKTDSYTFNQTNGGGGAYGYRHTPEEIERRRNRVGYWKDKGGELHPVFGTHRSEETKAKHKETLKNTVKKGKNSPAYGRKTSPETRKKQSLAKSGSNHWAYGSGGVTHYNYGKSLSQEHKTKISEALTGKIVSDETRKKMSDSQKGKVWSVEQKQAMSDIKKNQPNKGVHSRWHTNRGVINPNCMFCHED